MTIVCQECESEVTLSKDTWMSGVLYVSCDCFESVPVAPQEDVPEPWASGGDRDE